MTTHLRSKGTVKRCRRPGPFHLRDHLPVVVDTGVELHQRDHVPSEAKHNRNPAVRLPDEMVDVLRPGQKLTLIDGILFCHRPFCYGLSGGSSTSQCATHCFVNPAMNVYQQICNPVKAILCNVYGYAGGHPGHPTLIATINVSTHSPIASSSTRSIPISQIEDAT